MQVIVDLFAIVGGLVTVVKWREGGQSLYQQIGTRDAGVGRYQVAVLITGVLLMVSGLVDMLKSQ
jgi:hypothetical protein